MESALDHLARAQAEGRIRFLVIGGRGLSAYGIHRFTKDLDLAVAAPELSTLEAILYALGYQNREALSQFVRLTHLDPSVPQIDVMGMSESTFSRSWDTGQTFTVREHSLRAPGIEVFLAMKLLAMRNQPERRPKDLVDLEQLIRQRTTPLSRATLQKLCERYGVSGDFAVLSPFLDEP